MDNNKLSNRGSSRRILRELSGVGIIGYNYNLGGYKPWPKVSRQYYLLTVKRMRDRGWIEESEKQGKKFLCLTKKGKLQDLMYKLRESEKSDKKKWDGKWRLAIFDIPEKGRRERVRIRGFLLSMGFCCLQKSVYIYPYELSGESVEYLKISGLDRFIRFLRVDQMDDENELRKFFGL